jgi:hypothetical protein
MAWKAICTRGVENQTIRKVKGHATAKDVQDGVATKEDKIGNDISDTNADIGVAKIKGPCLVKLASWIVERHNNYTAFMGRIHKVIAGVTLAEKEERKKRQEIAKATLGYDPKVWKDTTAKVKEQQLDDEEYQQLQLGDPVEGKHRCSQHAVMYKDIHAFMKNRKWAPTDAGSHVGGVTWLELFIIFDITGARSHNGDHVKDKEAAKRAEARSAKVKKTNRGKETQNAIVKPKLGEELARFKAIVRHIAKHEVKGKQADYFLMEKRQHLTRLAGLAVYGHQPAIAGFLQISSHEKEDMIKAILMQKVGSNAKTIKSHVDLRRRQQ